jgi:hypothetical protein
MHFSPQRSSLWYVLKMEKAPRFREAFCDPAGARTQDPNIKSVVLYRLSYRIFQPLTDVLPSLNGSAKVTISS